MKPSLEGEGGEQSEPDEWRRKENDPKTCPLISHGSPRGSALAGVGYMKHRALVFGKRKEQHGITKEMVDYVSTLSPVNWMKRKERKMQGELQPDHRLYGRAEHTGHRGCGAHEPCVPGEERAAGGRVKPSTPGGPCCATRRCPMKRRFWCPRLWNRRRTT